MAALRSMVSVRAAFICDLGQSAASKFNGNNSKSPKNRKITPEQFRHRMILRQAMMRHGFRPLSSEWWHFTLNNELFPDTYFTFPVK